jgi:hypothetical protein
MTESGRQESYPVWEIRLDWSQYVEQVGTKEKFWIRREGDNRKYLFKIGRPGTGENWAEKIACEIAGAIGIPHATYNLATLVDEDTQGVITESFVPSSSQLILGNDFLAEFLDGYDGTKRYRQRSHTVNLALAMTRFPGLGLPLGFRRRKYIRRAADVLVGYLMLDALIGNTDRHHENWGIITGPEIGIRLAPTFDHASSLGRNESDERRHFRLTTNDPNATVRAYAKRAKSAFYKKGKSNSPLTTMEAFNLAQDIRPEAGVYWRNKLEGLQKSKVLNILGRVPGDWMSKDAKQFALEMIAYNRETILLEK